MVCRFIAHKSLKKTILFKQNKMNRNETKRIQTKCIEYNFEIVKQKQKLDTGEI